MCDISDLELPPELDPATFMESALIFCMCEEEYIVEFWSPTNVGLVGCYSVEFVV